MGASDTCNNYHIGLWRRFEEKVPGQAQWLVPTWCSRNISSFCFTRILNLPEYSLQKGCESCFSVQAWSQKVLGLNLDSATSLLDNLRQVIQPPCACLSLSMKTGTVIVFISHSPWENCEIIHIKSWHIINTNKWLTKISYIKRASLGKNILALNETYMIKLGEKTIRLCRGSCEDMGRPFHFLNYLWINSKSPFSAFPQSPSHLRPPLYFSSERERFFKAASLLSVLDSRLESGNRLWKKNCLAYIFRDKEEMPLHPKWNQNPLWW